MKQLILIPFIILLAGCVTNECKPIVETKVIRTKVPEEMLTIPPYGPKIDPDKMTQKDVSRWAIETEQRMQLMEDQLRAIKVYNNKE